VSDTARRVREAARDASSNDDLVDQWGADDPLHPLDEETLDEQASTQLGEIMWETRRRDAN
jgi:hypothetical protein